MKIIKKKPALIGILKSEVTKFLCFEKWVLSGKKFFFIIASLKIKNKIINKKKNSINYLDFFYKLS